MLKVDLITVGKLKEDYLRRACEEYQKRLGAFVKLQIIELPSEQLAETFLRQQTGGISQMSFIIGGSWGLDPAVKQRSNLKLSMSRMTFPHQLARVMLLEQIYRACSINNHSKYHK